MTLRAAMLLHILQKYSLNRDAYFSNMFIRTKCQNPTLSENYVASTSNIRTGSMLVLLMIGN